MDWKEELTKLVDEAVGDKTGEKRDNALWAALKEHLPSEYRQAIFNKGHASATAETRDKIDSLETERDTLNEKLTASKSRIAELESKKLPDDASEREQQLATQVEELKNDLQGLKDQREADKKQYEAERKQSRIDSTIERIRVEGHKQYDDPWFDLQLREALDEGRFDVEGDRVVIRQKGRETPIQADSEKDLVGAFLDEVSTYAPDTRVKSNVDAGGGSSGGGSGAGKWERYQKAAKGNGSSNGLSEESRNKRLQGMT